MTQILIRELSFHLSTGQSLFNGLNLTLSQHKMGIIGRNGIGKSTLLKLIARELDPASGTIQMQGSFAYMPQQLPLSPKMTVAGFLNCAEKINALSRIMEGSLDENDFSLLNDDWDIKNRVLQQLSEFNLETISLDRSLSELSGGEVTRLMLTKTFFSDVDFLLLDEPTNHLDHAAKQKLYHAIKQWPRGLIIVSHDRELLNLMEEIIELTTLAANIFGGNYTDYRQQKDILLEANTQRLADAKKLLDKTKRSIQSTKEKHAKREAQGRDLRRAGGQPKIILDSMESASTKSQGKLSTRYARMLENAETQLQSAKENSEAVHQINVELPATQVPHGKIILTIDNLGFAYPDCKTIIQNINLILQGPARIALKGKNGSGKTTLIKLILGQLKPSQGNIVLGTPYISYLDQETSLLNPELSILENFMTLNTDTKENDAYQYLARFLFRNTAALKLVKTLSGGEKLRASLACTLMAKQPPQLLILDEPTNHLDLESIQNIELALQSYQGAMIVISHDHCFLENIGIDRVIEMHGLT